MNEFPSRSIRAELARLREENSRLKSLLRSHGIPWEEDQKLAARKEATPLPSHEEAGPLDSTAKISLFRRLFRGRTDVYPIRWESAKGKSGYTPACENEWRPGLCGKPQVKCTECEQRKLLPVTDQVIYDHLAGKHAIGVYPLMTPAFSSRSISTKRTSVKTLKPSCSRVPSCRYRPLWRFPVLGMVLTLGSSLPRRCRRVKHGVWVRL